MTKQAKAGGETGLNGEFYQGGEFMPSSAYTVKGENKRAKSKKSGKPQKCEIANYKWEVRPAADMRSIYSWLGVSQKFNQTGYSKETGSQGYFELTQMNFAYFGLTEESMQALINKWNAGERWISKDELAAL